MGIPQTYRTSQEKSIFGFDDINMISGGGYITFYGWSVFGNFDTGLKLTSYKAHEDTDNGNIVMSEDSPSGEVDTITFTGEAFQNKIIVEGNAILDYIWGYKAGSAINLTGLELVFEIYKNDELIGSDDTTTYATGSASIALDIKEMQSRQISITKTIFNKGDVLKLKIIANATILDTIYIYIGASPNNKDTSEFTIGTNADFTNLKLNIPVIII